ncbi:hypothetical protein AMQ83_31300, partial [Paenibacillus riograndensis]
PCHVLYMGVAQGRQEQGWFLKLKKVARKGGEVWNWRSDSVRLYVWLSTVASGLIQEIQT